MRDAPRSPRLVSSFIADLTRPASNASALGRAARAATVLWLVLSAVNLVVWLTVCVISGSIDSPWWLWAFAAGGAVVGGLHLAARSYRVTSPADADTDGTYW